MHFLYPSDPIRTKSPDEFYSAELAAIRAAGFGASVFSFEEFQTGDFRPYPPLPADELVYRGWMLSAEAYELLLSFIHRYGAIPFTDRESYLAAHHLPNWYPQIADFTPETRVFPLDAELADELTRLDWPGYFIKDHVKSLKTSVGSLITNPADAAKVISEMRRFRGMIEGGFCVRRVENFRPETEQRYFVLDSVPYAPIGQSVPDIVSACAMRINSRFFSVDAIERQDGVTRIVEVGDGQVSDLVGWNPDDFAAIFKKYVG